MSNIIEEQLGLNFVLKETYSSSSRLVPTTIIKFLSVMFLGESRPLESSLFSTLSRGEEQYEILFTMLHILEIFNFKESLSFSLSIRIFSKNDNL